MARSRLLFLHQSLVGQLGEFGGQIFAGRPRTDHLVDQDDLAIGANAQLGQVNIDGDRMAVYLKGVLKDELLVIDAKRGRLISRIKLDKSVGPPRSAW